MPPLPASFAAASVAVSDISATGARIRHEQPLEMGSKSILKLSLEGVSAPVALEAVIVWTRADLNAPGRFVSGARTYGTAETVERLLGHLQTSHRSNRIEELRSSDRFFVTPSIPGTYGDLSVEIDNLSARGARIAMDEELPAGSARELRFRIAPSADEVVVTGRVAWSGLKSVAEVPRYRAGLMISEKREVLRLVIAQLCDRDQAMLDTQSLPLKLKVLRARARQLAPAYGAIEAAGIPAEQYLLIQGVREELRLNPEEAIHWYRRARITIADPAIRSVAPPIANHPDALAVWEYLDRSVDPTIVGRAFELPR